MTALTLIVAGCSSSIGSARSPTASPVEPASPPKTPSATASSAPSQVLASMPPTAALAVEGGDPTDGQLGTYTWGDGGSDAPWLPGARIAVGSGEPLNASFTPEIAVETWSARYVPSTADGPADATVLGEGSGQPRFTAPGSGTWTVEVRVVFADAAGTASYFWQLAVD